MVKSPLEQLAPPAVVSLVLFLSLASQWLFTRIEPRPLSTSDTYWFNALVFALLVCYYRTWTTGTAPIPTEWHDRVKAADTEDDRRADGLVGLRYCRKCEAYKPPRTHHCKTCERCIMKMDHHCVWTANCVSHTTLPHFVRFLFYAVTAMTLLEFHLYVRVAVLWQKRHLPSYLGPSSFQLGLLFALVVTNSFVLFMLLLLFGKTIWSLSLNMTTIEGWEVERHHAVLRRARTRGGFLEGPDGASLRIEHQEFPWDVGIWTNLCQGMGSSWPFMWFWPFATDPSPLTGVSFPHNEIDDPSKPWPPPDPDKIFRSTRVTLDDDRTKVLPMDRESFYRRQQSSLARYQDEDGEFMIRRRPIYESPDYASSQRQGFNERVIPATYNSSHKANVDDHYERPLQHSRQEPLKTEVWRNEEGERLADFGVDEDDEDDVPLAQIKQRLEQKGR